MEKAVIAESELIEVVVYTFIAFVLMGLVLILFFYFSRKKIAQKEIEKKDLELQYQKELLSAVIITQEEERKRIAQDLHDDISSKLNIVALNSHLLTRPNLNDNDVLEITRNIIDLTSKALDNSRKIAYGLLPPVLDKFGLHAGMQELCLEFSSLKDVEVNYICKSIFNPLDKDRHLHVFRILQELMNNSLRHGKATIISILLEDLNGFKNCTYTDNGIGFETGNNESKKGLGLKNIESRITFLRGTMHVKSAVGNGISVVFSF
jgi:signal transduction histidine kinase